MLILSGLLAGLTTANGQDNESFVAGHVRLDEVLVKGYRPPVEQRGDTVVFNANAFRLPQGAYLEALVRRIPGLQYDSKTQSILYNGYTISEIVLNGKEFFRGNRQMALENLPASFISQVKVYDKATEEEKATGVKTGFTSKAGRCLVFGARREDMELIGVVLGCSDWFDEAERLLDGCFERYAMVRMLGPTISAGRMAVEGGAQDSCGMCVMEEMSVPLESGEAAQAVLDVPQSVRAPVYPGMHLGTVRLVVGGKVYKEAEVVASERVRADSILLDVQRIAAHWILSGRTKNAKRE